MFHRAFDVAPAPLQELETVAFQRQRVYLGDEQDLDRRVRVDVIRIVGGNHAGDRERVADGDVLDRVRRVKAVVDHDAQPGRVA
jgi:hypothetical protein